MVRTSETPIQRLCAPQTTAPDSEQASAASHAKVILAGEHAVVYGLPAIVLPIRALSLTATVSRGQGALSISSDLYAGPIDEAPPQLKAPVTAFRATLEVLGSSTNDLAVTITGHIPPERGLGSSAAVAAAISQAVARYHGVTLNDSEHFELIQVAERVAHGTPSGLDARGVVAERPLWFDGGLITPISIDLDTSIVVADSGIRGRTREVVADVRMLRQRHPDLVSRLINEISQRTNDIVSDLCHDRRQSLGRHLSAVHQLLAKLTVSNEALDRLVHAALDAGALGAKLTGGGRGGCILALADEHESAQGIARALEAAGAQQTWITSGRELNQ